MRSGPFPSTIQAPQATPSLLDRIFRRHPPANDAPAKALGARPGSLPVTATIEAFVARAATVRTITAIVARSHGESVDFVVSGDEAWHLIIDKLEPKLTDLIVAHGAAFDYTVVRPGMDPEPQGYLNVYTRA